MFHFSFKDSNNIYDLYPFHEGSVASLRNTFIMSRLFEPDGSAEEVWTQKESLKVPKLIFSASVSCEGGARSEVLLRF